MTGPFFFPTPLVAKGFAAMSDYSFRQHVRDEVIGWLDQQKGMLDAIVVKLAERITPII